MPDGDLDRLLAALAAYAPAGADARTLADAVWLAAARSAADSPGAAAPAGSPSARTAGEPDPGPAAAPRESPPPSTAPPHGPDVSAHTPGGSARVRGTPLSVGRADALPETLALGRALQPFRRAWRGGSRSRLDVDATVDHYARGGPLVPLFSPRPERWFEVVALVDTSLSMSMWEETAQALTRLLGGLGAFRRVSTWKWTWADGRPGVRDHGGASVPPDRVPHHGSGARGRRLLLVFTDCAARGWHGPAPWQLLSAWGRRVPVLLVDPLPPRLWRRSALDLPAVRATAAHPGGRNSTLRHRLPLRWRPHSDTSADLGPWQALPVAACTPHSLGRWAKTVMGTDPAGCDAVLVPAAGRLPQPTPVDAGSPVDPETLADAFLRTASAPAVRLAILCSHLPELTLPLLHALREQAVPEARLADLAEFLTSGLLTVTRVPGDDPVLTFREPARARLGAQLTTHDAWEVLRALTRHLEAHPHAPHGIAAVLHLPEAVAQLPAQLQPFAQASLATKRRLGVGGGARTAGPGANEELPATVLIGKIGRTTELSGGTHLEHVGTGVLLEPRLILAMAPQDGELVAIRARGRRVEEFEALCQSIWHREDIGIGVFLTGSDLADPGSFTPPGWTEPLGAPSAMPCHLIVPPPPGRAPEVVLGVLRRFSSADLVFESFGGRGRSVPKGAPVLQMGKLVGLVGAPLAPDRFSVVGISELDHLLGFLDAVRSRLPRGDAPKRPSRFLIGDLPSARPGDVSALARELADHDWSEPLVLGGEEADRKRHAASGLLRREWDERTVDVAVWVTGSTVTEIRTQYAAAEAVIAGSPTAVPDDAARAFLDRLRTMRRPWIVVVDGLDEPVLPEEVRPPLTSFGRVLVTGSEPRLLAFSSRAPAAGAVRSTHYPYFFLSWARTSAEDPYVNRFYNDLMAEVSARDPDFFEQPSFSELSRLSSAVGSCRTFVALYSPAYFSSPLCGREFAAFSERLRRHQQFTDVSPPALVPVMWSPPPASIPDSAARYQWLGPAMGEEYARHGLLHLLRTDPNGEPYRRVVSAIASAVRVAAEHFRLPTTPDLDLASVPSAFPGQAVPERSTHAQMFFTPGAIRLAERAKRILQEEGLTASVDRIAPWLTESLDEAERRSQVSVLIIDQDSLHDAELQRILFDFDRVNRPFTGVIVLQKDAADDLSDTMRGLFSRNWARRTQPYDPLFRIGVTDDRFDELLAVMVTVATNRLMDMATPHRLPSGPPAPPLLGAAELPAPPLRDREADAD